MKSYHLFNEFIYFYFIFPSLTPLFLWKEFSKHIIEYRTIFYIEDRSLSVSLFFLTAASSFKLFW